MLIYRMVLMSAGLQSDLVTFYFHILSHHGLSQDINYSSICYAVGHS